MGMAYPGIRAPIPTAYAESLYRLLAPVIQEVFELPGWQLTGHTSDFSLVTRRPEDLHPRQCIPHVDTTDTGFIALLHYIAPPGHGGTSFYRHRATGFETITAERLPAFDRAIAGELQANPQRGYIHGDSDLFERTASFGAVFNSMIIYRGAVLHSGDIAPDFEPNGDPRTGRLTANTFFRFAPAVTAR
jgi:hypothetical protein